MRDDSRAERNHLSVAALYASEFEASASRATEPLPTIARGTLAPPRLQAITPTGMHSLPHATIADLRFPALLVQARAEGVAERARAGGASHSLRLWRIGYEQALLSLAREACRVGETALCESLFWEQRDDEFCVSVTFGAPARSVSH